MTIQNDSGKTVSVWMVTTNEPPTRHPLPNNITADVCIVGGGIAGITTAYLLAKEGRSVVLLEDGPIGGGMTGRTTAHLSFALDDRYFELERLFGEQGARRAADSHKAAVDMIEQIVRDESIDCDFQRLDGYLFVPPGDSTDVLDRELAAATRAGVQVQLVDRAPLDSFNTGPALRFPNQGQFHPLAYLNSLADSIERLGGKIFTETHATEINGGENTSVKTSNGHTVHALSVVVATNTPVNDIVAIHTKQAPYTTYVIGARIPKGSVPRMLLWDTPDPYHYVRLHSEDDHDVLIVGGEDHKTGQASDFDQRYERLEAWARERFPMIDGIKYRWSGEVMEPVDGMAFIGRNPGDAENVYIITGDSGQGMTHGTIGGMLITDLIAERQNDWSTIYDPSRMILGSVGEFARENLNVAAQYSDLVTGGEVSSVDEIPPGEGAIIRNGLSKAAVYRDARGRVHAVSAICTHLGCVVRWNRSEETWDCPCHGSRFEKTGRVIMGPANNNLEPVDLAEDRSTFKANN